MKTISTADLHDRHLDLGQGIILDARGVGEFAAGHVPGAVNIPHDQLATRLDELDKAKPIYVHCAMGGRAQQAAAVLEANGFDVFCVTTGGMKEWASSGYPTS